MTLRIINDFEEEETRACFKEPLSNEPDKYHDEPHSGNQNKRRDDIYMCVCVPKQTQWRHHTSLLQSSSTKDRRISAHFLYFKQRTRGI